MRKIQLSQFSKNKRNLFALVDDEDFKHLNQFKWSVFKSRNTFYASRNFQRKITLMMHRIILDCPKGMEVDHINGDGLDNRRENLRIATRQQNSSNRKFNINNTSGYRGITQERKTKKWSASIRKNGKRIHLGTFVTARHAALCHDLWAKDIYGEFAGLNF